MKRTEVECEREPEVLAVIRRGEWPARAGPELRAHVNECASCDELAIVALAIVVDREALMRQAAPPPSAAMWRAVA